MNYTKPSVARFEMEKKSSNYFNTQGYSNLSSTYQKPMKYNNIGSNQNQESMKQISEYLNKNYDSVAMTKHIRGGFNGGQSLRDYNDAYSQPHLSKVESHPYQRNNNRFQRARR
mmetsp:Transcript_31586/g.27979  ORF Transcript_31586/g.27979 Transcript_31586/m.27979 type:complete len:114 (+) Transcript_31586:500-841(+)